MSSREHTSDVLRSITPKRATTSLAASVDPAEARNATGFSIHLERAQHIERSGDERVRIGDKEARDGAYMMWIADLKRHLIKEERVDYE
jgi:hypothetical protein